MSLDPVMSLRWRMGALIVLLAAWFTLPQTPAETPAAAALRVRRVDAESRALFQSDEPLVLTLAANFGLVTRDRDPASTKLYPGTVSIADPTGRVVEIPVQLSARGNLRRSKCGFLPLRVAFPKPESKGTPFEMRAEALKLVTHCSGGKEYEQYILREYLAYRIANIVTRRSFRARLARITCVDSVKGKTLSTRYAIFLEDDDDVARRLQGKIDGRRDVRFNQLHPVALTEMSIFQFMIGNTDYSIMGQHNMRLAGTAVV